jgi:tetratricopeptide (TPR) repeat protein
MSLDAYQPCPCGIDKKIKFCCGPEIIDDLAKIEDALAGEQRLGALDLTNRLLEKKPDRPCLLMHKATIQMALRELDSCRQTIDHLLKVAPGNPGGLAIGAMLDCQEGKAEEAVDKLQSALEAQQGKLIPVVYEAIGIIARTLDAIGEPLAAQAYAVFQAAASQGKDRNAVMTLLELEASGQIPLAVQGMTGLVSAPAESSMKAASVAEFNAALKQADLGCWRKAATLFEALGKKEPNEPSIPRNIGVCRLRILNNKGAAEAFHRFSGIKSVPRDDAVEAEALTQHLRDPSEIDTLPEVTITYALTDASALHEQLLSSKRVQKVPFDPAAFREANEPAPLGVFLVLDREIPANSSNLTRDNVPKVLGEMALYGKETDRPARAEFTAVKSSDFDSRVNHLLDLLGSFAGEKLGEEESGRMSAVAAALSINWRFPDDTSVEIRKKLMQEQRTLALLSIWPNLPMGVLDGKTPRQAVADPAGQIRVQGIILQMDLAEPVENPEYNKLRRSLGLPTLETIDPSGVRVESLSPARLARLDFGKATDEQLIAAYRRAVVTSSPRLLRGIGLEIVSRSSLDSHKDIDKAEVYDILARMALDADEAVGYLAKAQELAKAKGKSPARYLLTELPYRLQRGEEQESRRIINLLTTKHAREPGVQESLLNLLAQLGLVRVDPATGRPIIMVPSGGVPGAAPSPLGGPAGSAAVPEPQSQSALWTPDQMAPSPAGGESKSKLWIPGMD